MTMSRKTQRALRSGPTNTEGSYRDVYDLGDGTVLKVSKPTVCGAQMANDSEYKLWRRIRRRKEAAHFARIIRRTVDGHLIVEKADELLEATVDIYNFDEEKCLDPALLAAADKYGLIDLHPGNIGIFNGKQKIIDYQTEFLEPV